MDAPLLSPAVQRFLEAARVAHLATVDAQGAPAVVPVCFQVRAHGANAELITPIDAKPKRGDWRGLQRVRNLRANPRVAIVVDRWAEDWTRLGWVHLRGRAALVEGGSAHVAGLALLRAKYVQYRAMPLEDLPLIVVTLDSATHWGDLTADVSPPHTPA